MNSSASALSSFQQGILKLNLNALQEALYKVHARVHDEDPPQQGGPSSGTGVTRMLVCHTQAGCLIGK